MPQLKKPGTSANKRRVCRVSENAVRQLTERATRELHGKMPYFDRTVSRAQGWFLQAFMLAKACRKRLNRRSVLVKIFTDYGVKKTTANTIVDKYFLKRSRKK
jgi:hypothetical protein